LPRLAAVENIATGCGKIGGTNRAMSRGRMAAG